LMGASEWRHRIVELPDQVGRDTASLIESASIGQMDGPDHQILVQISGVTADLDRERIFIVDYRIPILRMYDFEGQFIKNIGREGAGPGEYRGPIGVAVHPLDGTIFLRTSMRQIIIYSPEGEYREYRRIPHTGVVPGNLFISHDGIPYTQQNLSDGSTGERIRTFMGIGSEGTAVDTILAPIFDNESPRLTGNETSTLLPFGAFGIWTISPSGARISGVPHTYTFFIDTADGHRITTGRESSLVEVDPREAAWKRKMIEQYFRRWEPSWRWRGPSIPKTKPAYHGFYADLSDRIWVQRPGPGILIEDGIEDPETFDEARLNPRWRDSALLDVFTIDGEFLWEVEIPEGCDRMRIWWAREDQVLVQVSDEDGVPMVKRFRLQPPFRN